MAAKRQSRILDYQRPDPPRSGRETAEGMLCTASWAIFAGCVVIPIVANNLNESQLSWEDYQRCFVVCTCCAVVGIVLGLAIGFVGRNPRVKDAGALAAFLNFLAALIIPAFMHA